MKKLPANPITAWSYSRLSVFRACRLQFRFKFIDKLPEPKSPAMARGSDIHLALQRYIEKKAKAIPAGLLSSMGPELAEQYATFRKSKAACELQLAVDTDWKRVEWFDKSAWLRVIYDVVSLEGDSLRVGDHKTGQVRPDQHAEQLEIYDAVAPSIWPDAKEVIAEMYYVDHGQRLTSVFNRRDADRLRKKWTKLAGPVFKEKQFPASPGQACRFCAYSARRGGPCAQG